MRIEDLSTLLGVLINVGVFAIISLAISRRAVFEIFTSDSRIGHRILTFAFFDLYLLLIPVFFFALLNNGSPFFGHPTGDAASAAGIIGIFILVYIAICLVMWIISLGLTYLKFRRDIQKITPNNLESRPRPIALTLISIVTILWIAIPLLPQDNNPNVREMTTEEIQEIREQNANRPPVMEINELQPPEYDENGDAWYPLGPHK